MRELECFARTCVHNDKCACKKDCIDINRSKDVAECSDYMPVGAVSYSYETAEERCFGATSHYHTNIHCTVNSCKYYQKERCNAHHVTINVDQIKEPGKVKCETYIQDNK